MIKLPPHHILNQFRATAKVELKEGCIKITVYNQRYIYLQKGTQGWIDKTWSEEERPSPLASPTLYFYWMGDSGVSYNIPVLKEDINIIEKLPAWNEIPNVDDYL